MQYEAHFENIIKCNQQMIKLSKQFESIAERNDALKFGSDLIGLQLNVERQLIDDIRQQNMKGIEDTFSDYKNLFGKQVYGGATLKATYPQD